MIEVIGKDQSVYKQVTCRECASILRYTNTDTTTRKWTDISGVSETIRELRCPTCSNMVEVRY